MSNIACTCDYDAVYPAIYDDTVVTARKDHRCCECSEAIPKGSEYHRISGLWDGRWDHYKICRTCMRIGDDLVRAWPFGDLSSCLRDCYGVALTEVPEEVR